MSEDNDISINYKRLEILKEKLYSIQTVIDAGAADGE
jgi:FkbM family methyltransferase